MWSNRDICKERRKTMTHKYGTNVPLAREQLEKIATDIEDHAPFQAIHIRSICKNLLTRKQSARRAPNTRSPVTQDVISGVITMLNETDLTQEQIAAHFNIDGGRVSEIARAAQ